MKFLRHNLATTLAILIAVPMMLGIFFTNFDLFDTGLKNLIRIEDSEIDELVLAFLVVISGLVIDRLRFRRQARRHSEIEEQRLRVLKATMRTVQDLMNNFLNNMQLFRMEAQDGPLSPESLTLLDDLIFGASAKLKVLGDLKVVIEVDMAAGPGIQVPHPLATLG